MAKLKKNVKVFIVEQLAVFQTPQEIVTLVKKNFNVDIDRMQVNGYDPTKPYYRNGNAWKTLFEQTRKDFLIQMKEIPIVHQAYRMQLLQKALDKVMRNSENINYRLMLDILELAAKEEGKMFIR